MISFFYKLIHEPYYYNDYFKIPKMKIVCLQENLLKGINIVSRFVSFKNQLPVLGNIFLKAEKNQLKLSATNLETGINYWLGAKVEKEGEFTIPAKIFGEFISSLPKDKVDIEKKEKSLKIKCLSYSAEINGLPADEYPKIPSFEKESFSFKKEEILGAIKQVFFSAATDEGRPVLTGILIFFGKKDTIFVATDGYRLSFKKINKTISFPDNKEGIKENFKIIVPAKTMMELGRIIEEEDNEEVKVLLTQEKNQITFHYGEIDLVTRLIEGEFPAYEKIIPENYKTKIVLSKEDFWRAIKTASIFARESANIVRLKIEKGVLKISANAPQVGKNEITLEGKQEGEENSIAFNSRYLLDFLANTEGNEVIFEMTESLSPGVFKTKEDNSHFHIIMPVRVQEEE